MEPGGVAKNTRALPSFHLQQKLPVCPQILIGSRPSDPCRAAPSPIESQSLEKKVAGTGPVCVSPSTHQHCSEQGAGVITIRVCEPRHLAGWGRGGTLKAFSSLLGEEKVSFRAL